MPRVNEADRVRQAGRVAARVVGGKAVVVVIDCGKLHTLNTTGTFAWERCDGRTVGELAEALAEAWGIERDQALSDVRRFVEELAAAGALLVEAAGEGNDG